MAPLLLALPGLAVLQLAELLLTCNHPTPQLAAHRGELGLGVFKRLVGLLQLDPQALARVSVLLRRILRGLLLAFAEHTIILRLRGWRAAGTWLVPAAGADADTADSRDQGQGD